MRFMLFAVSIITFALGAGMFMLSKTAVHEVEALVMLVICAVSFAGAAIVDAIAQIGRAQPSARTDETSRSRISEPSLAVFRDR